MDLKQKNYVFVTSVAIVDEEKAENIFLKINDKLTTIKLLDLFVEKIKFSFNEKSENNFLVEIKGWSILQLLKTLKDDFYNSLKIGEEIVEINFCFKEETECIELQLINIETPFIQFNDKEIEEEDLNGIFKKILELSISGKAESGKGAGVGSPHSEPALFSNPNYENFSERFKAKGFEIFNGLEKNKNFHLFINEKTIKSFLIEVISESEAIQYNELTEKENLYQFVDEKNNRLINASLDKDNSVNIEFEPLTKEEVVK